MVCKLACILEPPGRFKNIEACPVPLPENLVSLFQSTAWESVSLKAPHMILICSQVWEPLPYGVTSLGTTALQGEAKQDWSRQLLCIFSVDEDELGMNS